MPAEAKHAAGIGFLWCRRRDSNSHSFRHYPLKIACLPISPRRHCMQSGKTTCKTRESLQDLNCNVFKQFVQRTKALRPKIYFGTPVEGADEAVAGDAANTGEAATGGEAAAAEAGAVAAVPSKPAEGFVRYAPRYVSASVVTKNTAASTAVVRERKFAEPVAPNRLTDA